MKQKEKPRRCATCQKLVKIGRSKMCQVLTELIGLDRDCFAWTDDPEWEEKAEQATREYAKKLRKELMKTHTIALKKRRSGSRKRKYKTELIGLDRDCFAWTDDPAWEKKVREATREYAKKQKEKWGANVE